MNNKMKKIVMLLMLLVSLASANAKCDWSKVSLGKSNKCNAYTFEVTGTVDTCYKHSILIVKKGSTTATYTGTSRVFSYTFKDTGYYYVKVSIKNKCCGGDTLIYNLIHVECKPAKCDWSKLGFGYSNSCNVYKFELGSIDTCISYTTYIYNYKTGRWIDTFRTRNFTKTFTDTGKYKVYSLAKNKCGGCDTSFYRYLTVSCKPTTTKKCDWSKIGLGYSNRCGTVTFELGSKDTCITGYSLWAYNWSTHKMDTIGNTRIVRRTLDTGWYTFKASFYNKCGNCDTFIYKEIYIGCDSARAGLKTLSRDVIRVAPNPADDRVLVCLTYPTKQPLVPYFIYNGSGQIVKDGFISSCVQLNTSSWKDGVYTFRSRNLTQRIVISH
jgi:hypothetical protein